ncbi:thiol-disulfide oxidoreductase [Bacillus sp. TS-2]|nr:thiol-disulfide oxidoreductase [Bacillus sp. TS-2]
MTLKLRSSMPSFDGATTWLNGEVNQEGILGEKPVFIHFWSISCELCREVIPAFNELKKQFQHDLTFLSIHMPRSEKELGLEDIQQVAQENGITEPIMVDNQLVLTDAFENEYVPSFYLFDKEGQLRHYQAGSDAMRMLTDRVQQLLDEEK